MKGFIELTDSLGNRCTLKATSIAKVCERKRYRIYEFEEHPELCTKDENGKWDKAAPHTYIQGEFPCRDLYVKESYEDVLKMMEEALKQ